MNRPHRDKDFEDVDLLGHLQDAGKRQHGASEDDPDEDPAAGLNALARRTALQLPADSYSPAIVAGMLRLFEFAGLALTGFLVFFAYLDMPLGASPHYTLAILAGSALAVAALQVADAYLVPAMRSAAGTLPRALAAWIAAFGILAAATFFLKLGDAYSRVWFASWFVCGAIFLVICRIFVAVAIRRWARNGRMERRAVIVGGGSRRAGPDPRAGAPAGQRHPHLRHLRRPRRRALAAGRSRLSEARQPRATSSHSSGWRGWTCSSSRCRSMPRRACSRC